jgi:hypothetical protein
MVFLYRGSRTKLECGLASRLGGRHACAQVLLDLQRKMSGNLFPQTFVGTSPCHKIRHAH